MQTPGRNRFRLTHDAVTRQDAFPYFFLCFLNFYVVHWDVIQWPREKANATEESKRFGFDYRWRNSPFIQRYFVIIIVALALLLATACTIHHRSRHLRTRTSRRYRYRYIITAVTTNTIIVLQYLFFVTSIVSMILSRISHGLKKHYRPDHLEIPRSYLWRSSLVFLLYKLLRELCS